MSPFRRKRSCRNLGNVIPDECSQIRNPEKLNDSKRLWIQAHARFYGAWPGYGLPGSPGAEGRREWVPITRRDRPVAASGPPPATSVPALREPEVGLFLQVYYPVPPAGTRQLARIHGVETASHGLSSTTSGSLPKTHGPSPARSLPHSVRAQGHDFTVCKKSRQSEAGEKVTPSRDGMKSPLSSSSCNREQPSCFLAHPLPFLSIRRAVPGTRNPSSLYGAGNSDSTCCYKWGPSPE